jgi:YspA, cpYpsA-related SLOG family
MPQATSPWDGTLHSAILSILAIVGLVAGWPLWVVLLAGYGAVTLLIDFLLQQRQIGGEIRKVHEFLCKFGKEAGVTVMDGSVVVELEGVSYRWDGKSWCSLADNSIPSQAVAARLDARLTAGLKQANEAEDFSRVVEAARAEQRPLRVLITGARTWTALEPVRQELARLPAGSTIIHGDADGADRLAGQVAAELGLEVVACPAEWRKYGKAAGMVRNRAMLEEHKPDLVLAFHPALEKARGTKHMVHLARKAKVSVRVVSV